MKNAYVLSPGHCKCQKKRKYVFSGRDAWKLLEFLMFLAFQARAPLPENNGKWRLFENYGNHRENMENIMIPGKHRET